MRTTPIMAANQVVENKELIIRSGERVSIGLVSIVGPFGISGMCVDVVKAECGCEHALIVLDENDAMPQVQTAAIGINHDPENHVAHGDALIEQEVRKAA